MIIYFILFYIMFMLKGCVIIPEHLLPQGGSEPPTNFSITTPINGQTIQDNTVQIQWSESTDPDNTNISYILYLWKSDSNGEYLIVDYRENIIIREETLSDLENGNYKIKIVAIDDDDHTSQTSEQTFIINKPVVPVVELTPPDNLRVQVDDPSLNVFTISWENNYTQEQIDIFKSYTLEEIDFDGNINTIFTSIDINDTNYVRQGIIPRKSYRYRVFATDNKDIATNFRNTRSIIYQPDVTSKNIQLLTSIQNIVNVDLDNIGSSSNRTFRFNWDDIGNLQSIEVINNKDQKLLSIYNLQLNSSFTHTISDIGICGDNLKNTKMLLNENPLFIKNFERADNCPGEDCNLFGGEDYSIYFTNKSSRLGLKDQFYYYNDANNYVNKIVNTRTVEVNPIGSGGVIAGRKFVDIFERNSNNRIVSINKYNYNNVQNVDVLTSRIYYSYKDNEIVSKTRITQASRAVPYIYDYYKEYDKTYLLKGIKLENLESINSLLNDSQYNQNLTLYNSLKRREIKRIFTYKWKFVRDTIVNDFYWFLDSITVNFYEIFNNKKIIIASAFYKVGNTDLSKGEKLGINTTDRTYNASDINLRNYPSIFSKVLEDDGIPWTVFSDSDRYIREDYSVKKYNINWKLKDLIVNYYEKNSKINVNIDQLEETSSNFTQILRDAIQSNKIVIPNLTNPNNEANDIRINNLVTPDPDNPYENDYNYGNRFYPYPTILKIKFKYTRGLFQIKSINQKTFENYQVPIKN